MFQQFHFWVYTEKNENINSKRYTHPDIHDIHFSHGSVFVIQLTVACQTPLSIGFSRQEYWSWLPCPFPEDLPNPGMEPTSIISPALADRFFT